MLFALHKVPTEIRVEDTEDRIRLREVGIKLQGTLERGPGYLVFNGRRIIAHMRICAMGVTFADPGGSIVRVKINRLIEELDRTYGVGLISFLDQIHPLQI